MSDYAVYATGLLAQALFSARLLVQWIRSERAGRVLSPVLFWQLSLLGSVTLCVYGILRDDPIIIAGQLVPYVVYIRNLQYKGVWSRTLPIFRLLTLLFPVAATLWVMFGPLHGWAQISRNPAISTPLLLLGGFGQVCYSLRFVYQWYASSRARASVLPPGFWYISLAGALALLLYGVYRYDPILILANAFGLFLYARNLFLAQPEPAIIEGSAAASVRATRD